MKTTKVKATKRTTPKKMDGAGITKHIAKLPYQDRNKLINELHRVNTEEAAIFGQGQEPDGKGYDTIKLE